MDKTLVAASRFPVTSISDSLILGGGGITHRNHSLVYAKREMNVQSLIRFRSRFIITDPSLRSSPFSPSSHRHHQSSNRRCSPHCSRSPPPNGDGKDDKLSTDWDKAWSKFKKQGKKTLFSQFSPNKYVTWNPKPSDYPSSEEVDPIKRTERSNLRLWTSPGFTLVGAIVIVSFLLIYTILAPLK